MNGGQHLTNYKHCKIEHHYTLYVRTWYVPYWSTCTSVSHFLPMLFSFPGIMRKSPSTPATGIMILKVFLSVSLFSEISWHGVLLISVISIWISSLVAVSILFLKLFSFDLSTNSLSWFISKPSSFTVEEEGAVETVIGIIDSVKSFLTRKIFPWNCAGSYTDCRQKSVFSNRMFSSISFCCSIAVICIHENILSLICFKCDNDMLWW